MSSLAGEIPVAPAVERPPSRWALYGAFAVIYLVWGSTFLGIRVAVETLPPLSMAAIRFLVSGGVLLLASSRVRPRPTLLQWRNAAVVGALFFLCNHGLVSSAARFIPSSLSCLIVATEVPIIALLSSAMLPNQPLTRAGLLGAALGVAGVVCLFVGNGSSEGAIHVFACLAVLGASLSWSLGAVLSQRLQFPPDPILRAAMQMTCGAVLLSAASLIRGEHRILAAAAFSGRSLVALTYLITFGSVLAFACYSYLLKHVRADTVATHVFVNPLVAVALGAWLGGEQLRPAHLISGLLILASVSVITLGQRRPQVHDLCRTCVVDRT
jgi:drug/metabolite transporter (DMT)-like permease